MHFRFDFFCRRAMTFWWLYQVNFIWWSRSYKNRIRQQNSFFWFRGQTWFQMRKTPFVLLIRNIDNGYVDWKVRMLIMDHGITQNRNFCANKSTEQDWLSWKESGLHNFQNSSVFLACAFSITYDSCIFIPLNSTDPSPANFRYDIFIFDRRKHEIMRKLFTAIDVNRIWYNKSPRCTSASSFDRTSCLLMASTHDFMSKSFEHSELVHTLPMELH